MPALPDRPCMRQLRRQAKDLLKALRVDAPGARLRIEASWADSRGSPPTQFRLTDAQRVIAREVGFESWSRLKQHVDGLRADDGPAIGGDQDGMDRMSEHEFAADEGWQWHIAPAKCDGGLAVVIASDGVVAHVMPGEFPVSSSGSSAPPVAVYIAQGGRDGYQKRELRPVFYGRDGERHALRSGCGGSGKGGGFSGFHVEPDALHMDDVAYLGIEAKVSDADSAE
jgi:hypothetical protein